MRLVGSSPKDRSDFVNAVLKYMAETFIESGDRESLVRLLATRFPDNLYFETPIEYYVAIGSTNGRSTGSILVFGEAYSQCHDEAARHHLAIVVHRAFIGSGIRGKEDAEFVRNAMKWYEKEKDHLAVREMYSPGPPPYDECPEWYDEKSQSPYNWESRKKKSLFVDKSSPSALKRE